MTGHILRCLHKEKGYTNFEYCFWEPCTPCFEKRNIHFYVNKCGFQIDQFWREHLQPEHDLPDAKIRDHDEGPVEMFRLVKVRK